MGCWATGEAICELVKAVGFAVLENAKNWLLLSGVTNRASSGSGLKNDADVLMPTSVPPTPTVARVVPKETVATVEETLVAERPPATAPATLLNPPQIEPPAETMPPQAVAAAPVRPLPTALRKLPTAPNALVIPPRTLPIVENVFAAIESMLSGLN